VLGIAIWSQLTIGWQWSAPAAPGTTVAMLVMSVAIVCFLGLALLAAVPLAAALCRVAIRRESRGFARPLLTAVAGAIALSVGGHHFGAGWPGTGGHPWAHRGLVPGSIASFSWASTLWVTSYWGHPAALASFPTSELAWMAACPFALLMLAIGSAGTVRRLPLSVRVLRYETRLATAAALAMAVFLAGAASWVISGGAAPRGLFAVGAIDDVGMLAMACALVVAAAAVTRAGCASAALKAAPRRPAR